MPSSCQTGWKNPKAPNLPPKSGTLGHLLGGVDTGREGENEKRARAREDPQTRAMPAPLGCSLPERDGTRKLAEEETAQEVVGRVEWSGVVSSVGWAMRMRGNARGSRRREGASDGGVPAGGRGMNACMPGVEWVSTNVISFLNLTNLTPHTPPPFSLLLYHFYCCNCPPSPWGALCYRSLLPAFLISSRSAASLSLFTLLQHRHP